MTTTPDFPALLPEQLDVHWRYQARPRLDGLTDEEYLWEPVEGCWNVHPQADGRAGVDFEHPAPVPAPVTTIAWRIAHLVVGVLAVRSANHFAGPQASYQAWDYAGTAKEALAQLDEEYARWHAGVLALSAEELARPCGPAEGPYADVPMAGLVLHINRETIHHLAEIALLRDLYAHR